MAYITIGDVRGEGITEAMASDSKITTYIARWRPVFDRMCGQPFEEFSATVNFDGDNSDTFFAEFPIISVVTLTVAGFEIDATNYAVSNNRTDFPDDRRNPMIALKNGYVFSLGRLNCSVEGTWGFTESDGATPEAIKWAFLKLVIEKLLDPIIENSLLPTTSGSSTQQGALIAEVTDDHQRKWAAATKSTVKTQPWAGITSDAEIIEIIKMYRAPMSIGSPSDWQYPTPGGVKGFFE